MRKIFLLLSLLAGFCGGALAAGGISFDDDERAIGVSHRKVPGDSALLDNDIKYIQDLYKQVKEGIEFSVKNGYRGSLYCNTLSENVYGKSYPAVGIFRRTLNLWYDGEALSEEMDQISNHLQMIIERTECASHTYYAEYLFDDGKLIFAYCKGDLEVRYYFKNNRLIKQIGHPGDFGEAYTQEDVCNNAKMYLKIKLLINLIDE